MYTIRTIRIKCILIFVYFCIVLLTATCWTAVLPRVELNAKMQKGLMVKAGATVLLEAEVFGKKTTTKLYTHRAGEGVKG